MHASPPCGLRWNSILIKILCNAASEKNVSLAIVEIYVSTLQSLSHLVTSIGNMSFNVKPHFSHTTSMQYEVFLNTRLSKSISSS